MWKSLEKEWKNVYERSDILRQSSSGMKNFPDMHFSPSHGENNSILIISRFYRLVEEISYHVFRSDKESYFLICLCVRYCYSFSIPRS